MGRSFCESDEKKKENFGEDDNRFIFSVSDMSCEHCVMSIRKAVSTMAGVSDVNVDLDAKQVAVSFKDEVDKESIKEAIKAAGYDVK